MPTKRTIQPPTKRARASTKGDHTRPKHEEQSDDDGSDGGEAELAQKLRDASRDHRRTCREKLWQELDGDMENLRHNIKLSYISKRTEKRNRLKGKLMELRRLIAHRAELEKQVIDTVNSLERSTTNMTREIAIAIESKRSQLEVLDLDPDDRESKLEGKNVMGD